MNHQFEPPTYSIFGDSLVTMNQIGEQNIFYILGTKGKGFAVHKEVADKYISPDARDMAVSNGDFLYFPEQTSAALIKHELSSQAARLNRREKADNRRKLWNLYPDYAKKHGIKPPPKSKAKER